MCEAEMVTPNRPMTAEERAEQIFRMIQNAIPIEDNLLSMIEKSIKEAVAAEREACAKVAENKYPEGGLYHAYTNAGIFIAEKIRARGGG